MRPQRAEPLLLSAAAGSGKTSVLVERFVRAVREDGIAPARILAITFTERAAGELRARVRARLLELGDREAARDTEAAFVGTFHGFCARLLRAHALAAGLDPGLRDPRRGPGRAPARAGVRGSAARVPRGRAQPTPSTCSPPTASTACAGWSIRSTGSCAAAVSVCRDCRCRTPPLPVRRRCRGAGR